MGTQKEKTYRGAGKGTQERPEKEIRKDVTQETMGTCRRERHSVPDRRHSTST